LAWQASFHRKISSYSEDLRVSIKHGFPLLDFDGANPSVVKSITQRDLLNMWLRLYAHDLRIPRIEEYIPAGAAH
jgi:hypothetical protein